MIGADDSSNDVRPELRGSSAAKMLKLIRNYSNVFRKKVDQMPPHRTVEHSIKLKDETPVSKNQYRLSPKEMEAANKSVKKLLEAGLIQPSDSPFNAPLLFVKKADGSLRTVLDYRALNAKTIRDHFPVPQIAGLLDKLSNARFFSKLDLASGFFQIRLNTNDCPMTAFSTTTGHYHFRVMPMELCNAPSTFQRLINSIFGKEFNYFVLGYFNDILIYSSSLEEHFIHVE
ncbi:hypothetical protein MP638_000550, partial [Amoeboaphelidium occidentale]